MTKKTKNNDDIFAKIANKTGGEVISKETSVNSFIDTGSLAVNFICSGRFIGGGIVSSRVTEFYGPPSSSKSLFGTNILRGTQKQNGYAILLDCENAINVEFMKKSSYIDTNRLLRYTPRTLEESFNLMYNLIREIRAEDTENPIVFVYDSITVSPCEREFKETDLPQNYNQAIFKKVVGRNEQPGERAKIISRELRKLTPLLEKNNATLFVINQTRNQIGVMYGCFSYANRVMLADGTNEKIGKIVNQKIPVKVMSMNLQTGRIESKKVIGWHRNGSLQEGEKFKLHKFKRNFGDGGFGYFSCTLNHKIIIKNVDKFQEIEAKELNVGDKVVTMQPYYLSKDQMQIVYGSILGDGSLRTRYDTEGNTYLRFNHGENQKDYCRYKASMFDISYIGSEYETKNNLEINLIPMYELNHLLDYKPTKYKLKNGKFIEEYFVPQEIADNLNELGLAIWYLDDGTYSGHYDHWGNGKCNICCKKIKNREIMLPFFDKMGLKPTIEDIGFVFNAENTYKLHSLICRFVPKSMQYKLHPQLRDLEGFEIRKISMEYKPIESTIVDIRDKKTFNTTVKFDLTVEDNSTYFIGGACVHNSPETTPGGLALGFYSSCRIRTQTQKKIESKVGRAMGINLKIQNKKNRTCRPFIQTEGIQLFFEYGVDPLSGLLSLLLQEERIVESGKGMYSVVDKFLPVGKVEYKFKSSKERNDVPLDLLFECPSIVDAENCQQVKEYLADFKEAMSVSSNGDFIEHIVKNEEDEKIDEEAETQ